MQLTHKIFFLAILPIVFALPQKKNNAGHDHKGCNQGEKHKFPESVGLHYGFKRQSGVPDEWILPELRLLWVKWYLKKLSPQSDAETGHKKNAENYGCNQVFVF